MFPATGVARADSAVLVVVDIQDRLSRVMSRREAVLNRTALLLSAAQITGVPVIMTRQYPQGLGDFDTELAQRVALLTAAPVVADKTSFDCFGEPAFCDALAGTGRRQLILCGMETHICVTQTALSALGEGMDVHVVADACCSQSDDSHAITLDRLRCAGATVTLAESVAYELVERAGTERFKALLKAVKGL
ncbi:MAG TPA: isochorismatase family protein [Coriobacteriia bacterium]|nr:isochorismatase family protein [Coriobacteriia bacterium]